MELDTIFELYQLISSGTEGSLARKQSIKLRKIGFNSYLSKDGFKKLAFDTRRIDQETEYNPRRGLQNYNRSDAFLSEAMGQKIIHLSKLKTVLEDLRSEFGRQHEWQDSNARVLLATLDQGLRIMQKDGDFSDAQPSQGSINYIEELLHVRYRLGFDDLIRLGEDDLKKVILAKDEELSHKEVNDALRITKSDVGSQSYDHLMAKMLDNFKSALEAAKSEAALKNYDPLMEKLFSGVSASADNKSVERTVTITIKDSYLDEK
jgi:hypothetical protein